jgi:hypothetical protein
MSEGRASGNMGCFSTAPDKQALKRETRALIKAAGGLEAAATLCRPGKTQLGNYQSFNADDYMPIDVVADLEAVTHGTAGWPILTRRLATMAGGAFVELPEPDAMDRGWYAELGTLAADQAGISQRICMAVSNDDDVDAAEVKKLRLIEACDDAILHLVNLRARFERIAEEGRG